MKDKKKQQTAELRYAAHKVEIREAVDASTTSRQVVGSILYNVMSNVLYDEYGNAFREVIMPGFFDGCLNQDTVANFNHQNNLIVARTTANSECKLLLSTNTAGLNYEFSAPNSTAGEDMLENIRKELVQGSSFRFIVGPDGDRWEWSEENGYVRYLLPNGCARLLDVCPVVFPAYSDSDASLRTVEIRSLSEFIETRKQADVPDFTSSARFKELELKFRKRNNN